MNGRRSRCRYFGIAAQEIGQQQSLTRAAGRSDCANQAVQVRVPAVGIDSAGVRLESWSEVGRTQSHPDPSARSLRRSSAGSRSTGSHPDVRGLSLNGSEDRGGEVFDGQAPSDI